MAKKKTKQNIVTKKALKPVAPKLDLLVPCDALSRDPSSGKSTLYGVFGEFRVHEIPTTVPIKFSVFMKFRGGVGKHKIVFEIQYKNKKLISTAKDRFKADLVFMPGRFFELHMDIEKLTIKKDESIFLTVLCDGKVLGKRYEIGVNLFNREKEQ